MFASTSASHRSGYAGDLCHSGVSEVVFVKKKRGGIWEEKTWLRLFFFDEKMGYDIFTCFFFQKNIRKHFRGSCFGVKKGLNHP